MATQRFELFRHDVENPLTMEVDQVFHLACPGSPVHYAHERAEPRADRVDYLPMSLVTPALDAIAATLRSGPPLRLAMLFGSMAKGRQRIDSDIDIGIIPVDPELSLADELTLQTELGRVSERQVDLVRLDRASTIVRWQVVRYGRPLLESERFAAARFAAEVTAEYLDFAPAFEHAAENFRRVLTGNRRAT